MEEIQYPVLPTCEDEDTFEVEFYTEPVWGQTFSEMLQSVVTTYIDAESFAIQWSQLVEETINSWHFEGKVIDKWEILL